MNHWKCQIEVQAKGTKKIFKDDQMQLPAPSMICCLTAILIQAWWLRAAHMLASQQSWGETSKLILDGCWKKQYRCSNVMLGVKILLLAKQCDRKKTCCQPIPRKIFQQLESDTGNLCDVIEKHRTIHFCTPSSLIRNCMVLMPHETHVHVKTNRRINKKVLLSNGLGQYGRLSIPYTFDCTSWKSYVQIHSELDSP